jgi:hypothetical protein
MYTNTDFGFDANTVFGGGEVDPVTGSASTGNTWADRVFGFGKDIFSGYLDLKTSQILLNEQTKLALAQQQQDNLLQTVEYVEPAVDNVTLQPYQLAAMQQSQSNDKLLTYGLIGVGLFLLLKKIA